MSNGEYKRMKLEADAAAAVDASLVDNPLLLTGKIHVDGISAASTSTSENVMPLYLVNVGHDKHDLLHPDAIMSS